ncbi:MAG: glycosyltransferase family 2 protein [Acidimicrobiales bacterium]|jgi:GT2 family glycosyltransferase
MTQAPLEFRSPLADRPTVTVVVCAYTELRWDLLVQAVESVRAQNLQPDQCVVVVDHNDLLLRRARASLPDDVEVVANGATRGLSGARNTGIAHSTGEIVAFLDDDAAADPGWLDALLGHYEVATVVGVGGIAEAVWPERGRPRWFPPEFDWVVGCSYVGLPEAVSPVRNPIGCSMSLRRSLFAVVGGFDTAMGRVGAVPLGCEETELAVRARRKMTGVEFLHVPHALVRHHVAPERARVGYFLRRCYSEGLSKGALSKRAGAHDALSSERAYVSRTLPRAVARGLAEGGRGDHMGFARAAMVVAGLVATAMGYAMTTKGHKWRED